MKTLASRRFALFALLLVGLAACSSMNPFSDPVDGWYASIEAGKFALVASLETIGELGRQGVVEPDEIEQARISGKAAKAFLIIANRNLARFKEGKATADVVDSAVDAFVAKVGEIEKDKERFNARSSPAPAADVIESEAIR